MGIFSRLTDIINANINNLLERAEDPEKMVRLMIQEMEDTLVEVRSQAVKATADKREIERSRNETLTMAEEWERKAEFALEKEREDLAKGALLAKRRLEDRIDILTKELGLVEEALGRHNEGIVKLQSKLQEAKARKRAFEIRYKTAKDRVRVNRAIADGRIDDALARYDGLERRIDELEADADLHDRDQSKTIEQEFAELEVEAELSSELERLKARLRARGGNSPERV
jgi:phage shock protein A